MLPRQQRFRRRVAPRRFGPTPSPAASGPSVIPYDYAAKFQLSGRPGNVEEDAIVVSADGIFVALAIGYGVDEERAYPLAFDQAPANSIAAQIKLKEFPVSALVDGIRVSPKFESLVFRSAPGAGQAAGLRLSGFSQDQVTLDVINRVFQRVSAPREISFLFAMVDSASGRELQDEPANNLASLGKSDGSRPFRALAQPLSFLPRSTIRLQIIERSDGVQGTLFVVLFGYKVLTGSTCPEPEIQAMATAISRGSRLPRAAGRDLIPFDYVAKFELAGCPGNKLEDEIAISSEGGFVATAVSYGMSAEDESVAIIDGKLGSALNTTTNMVDLNEVPLEAFPLAAVAEGFRIRPEFLRFVLTSGGGLAQVPLQIAKEAFETLNRPEHVSFLYRIYDGALGSDWQNQPIHNIAGLGIANGQRPFKKLARPRVFGPRSTLRVTVEERFGRGTLYIVIQGYKLSKMSPLGGAT
jgi:hypothetical protein